MDEQEDQLVEEPFQILSIGHVVVLVDGSVVGQAHRGEVCLATVPDQDFHQPIRGLEFDTSDRLSVVRKDREYARAHRECCPGLRPFLDSWCQRFQRKDHSGDGPTSPTAPDPVRIRRRSRATAERRSPESVME